MSMAEYAYYSAAPKSAMDIDYNAVAAFERSKRPKPKVPSSRVFTVILLAVFFVVMMGGLAAGVSMYQAVANNQIDTNKARTQAGLLSSYVHANDTAGTLGTGNGPEGRSLVLTERGSDGATYEMRIYLYQGNIVQEYSMGGSAYTPERAQPLIASSSFAFELRGPLLIIQTDQGVTSVALRSSQGGVS